MCECGLKKKKNTQKFERMSGSPAGEEFVVEQRVVVDRRNKFYKPVVSGSIAGYYYLILFYFVWIRQILFLFV